MSNGNGAVKVGGPIDIESDGSGNEQLLPLDMKTGGYRIKNFVYFIRVLKADADTELKLQLMTTPDGQFPALQSTPISYTAAATTAGPLTLWGATKTDTDGQFGDFYMPEIGIKKGTAGSQVTATIEVWEMQSPF